MSPLSMGPTNTAHSEEVRAAISLLCREVLQQGKSTALGTRDSEEIEIRMGPLVEHVRERERGNGSYKRIPAWRITRIGLGTGTTGEERERILFAEALRDGYVLCQFLNKLRPGSIVWFDPHEDGMRGISNVIKFLDSCFINGLPPEDVFLHDDLINATPDSLTRVARTIIALVKRTEKPPSTRSFLLYSEGYFKLDEGSSILPLRPRVTTGTGDDSPHLQSLGLSEDGAITHTTRDQPVSPPTRGRSIFPPIRSGSTTSSRRNQSFSSSTRNLKGPPSMKNQIISRFLKNRSISSSAKNMYPSTNMSHSTNMSLSTARSPSTNVSLSTTGSPSTNMSLSMNRSPSTNMDVSTSPLLNPSPNPSPLVSITPSTNNMSIPPSSKNQNMSLPPSTDNRPIAPSRLKQFVTPSGINVSSAHTFSVGGCIGRGSWGSVYHSLDLNTGQTVAVKLIGLVHLKEKQFTQLMEELDLVKQLSHPSIIKYEGMTWDSDEDALRIVLEYAANDSLKKKLESSGKLNETLVANYVVKILEGLDFLHRNGIVHGNLKAANIFTTDVGNVKLSDFGLSLNRLALWGEVKNISCAPNWAAPEIIRDTGSSTKSDIWSLGCTVIELLTGHPPYGDIPDIIPVRFRMAMDDYPPIPEHFSRPLTSFLKRCFQRVPAHRPSIEELLEHEWLKYGMNKDMQTPDTKTTPHGVNSEESNNDTLQHSTMDPDLIDTSTSKSVRPLWMWWHRICQVFSLPARRRPRISGTLHAEPDPHIVGRGHRFVGATFDMRAFAPSFHHVAADHRGPPSRHLSGVHGTHEKGGMLVLTLLPCGPPEVHRSRARGMQRVTEVPHVNPVFDTMQPNIIVSVPYLPYHVSDELQGGLSRGVPTVLTPSNWTLPVI